MRDVTTKRYNVLLIYTYEGSGRTGYFLDRAFRRHHSLSVAGPRQEQNDIYRPLKAEIIALSEDNWSKAENYAKRMEESPDICVVVESGHLNPDVDFKAPQFFKGLDCATACWWFDSNRAESLYVDWVIRQNPDVAFFSNKGAAKRIAEKTGRTYGDNCIWLPFAADPSTYFKIPDLPEIWDVVLVGSGGGSEETWMPMGYRRRSEIMKKLIDAGYKTPFQTAKQFYPLWDHLESRGQYQTVTGSAHVTNILYNMSKVLLNYNSSPGFINTRLFETMATGRMVLIDRLTDEMRSSPPKRWYGPADYNSDPEDGLLRNQDPEGLFEDMRELVTYERDNDDDLMGKLQYYCFGAMGPQGAREEIGVQGRRAVLQHHTFEHRVETIVKTMERFM